MERIDVSLDERSYPIFIGAGLLSKVQYFETVKGRNVVVITNETIAPLYADLVMTTLNKAGSSPALFVLPDGEQYKSIDTFYQINTFLLEGNYGRDTVLIALGGGVIGDIVGFVAACYQRGVDFIQIPTTLLAQVDSSVGGKTAINHPLGKNMIGAFYQPKSVIIDINVLKTLAQREWASGMAEVIKYGIIADAGFFSWLENKGQALNPFDAHDGHDLIYAISRCCQIKADVVAKDEKEAGQRALLNLGHTFGHAIEAEMGYGVWLHGEAVAVGMLLAAQTAYLQGLLESDDVLRIKKLLKKVSLPVKAPSSMNYDAFITHMKRDKKVIAGQLRFVLPTSIGTADVIADVSRQTLADVIASH